MTTDQYFLLRRYIRDNMPADLCGNVQVLLDDKPGLCFAVIRIALEPQHKVEKAMLKLKSLVGKAWALASYYHTYSDDADHTVIDVTVSIPEYALIEESPWLQ